ncbi:MAG: hypothetical protein KC592_15945 [Nitrospira sp.]|nr:hypothetical protein [Nitrospira sp.]
MLTRRLTRPQALTHRARIILACDEGRLNTAVFWEMRSRRKPSAMGASALWPTVSMGRVMPRDRALNAQCRLPRSSVVLSRRRWRHGRSKSPAGAPD